MKTITLTLLAIFALTSAAIADDFRATFTGYQAVPTLSLPGSTARAAFSASGAQIAYTLSYNINTTDPAVGPGGIGTTLGGVQQVHVHLGRPRTNGGVTAFLCSNLGNAPAGTPLCPASPATVTGTLFAGSIVGPSTQGIAPGDLAEVLAALRRPIPNFYGCVHTDGFPGGSIRGAVRRGGDRENDD